MSRTEALADDPIELARLVDLVAEDLDRRGYNAVGVVRRAARVLASLPSPREGCPVCGGPVLQPATGRRRTYCNDRCKRRWALVKS